MVPELSKKQRKALVILSVTGGVYISFKYFLPLILPFAAAYLAALVLRPGAAWIEKRLQINIRGRRYSVPIGVIGGAELLLLAAAAGLLLFCGSRRLMEEANEMIHAAPGWMMRLDQWLTSLCRTAEVFCRLREGALVQAAREMITAMTRTLRQAAMSSLAVNSVAALSFCARAFVMAAVFFMAAVLSLQEMDEMKRRRRQSMFSREFALFGRRLIMTGSAWLRTQLVIMLVTACLCALGLLLIRNPYSILLGAVIGVLDALPLFGAGAVLIPWSVVAMAQGHFYQGGSPGASVFNLLPDKRISGGQADGRENGPLSPGDIDGDLCGNETVWNSWDALRPHRPSYHRGSGGGVRRKAGGRPKGG